MKPARTRAINPHLLTGAHALDALPDDELRAFETHLGKCCSCADELSELRDTAAWLGSVAGRVVPIALRPQVLNATRGVWQVPPGSEVGARLSRSQGFRRAAALVAAACVTAMAVAGAHCALVTPRLSPPRTAPHTPIGDLLAAPDLRLLATEGPTTATAAISQDRKEMLFLADDLRSLPSTHSYQLWLVDGHGPRSAAAPQTATRTMSLLVSGIDGVREVILTVEPVGGSPSPTGASVVTLGLP